MWEEIEYDWMEGTLSDRLKVPGGWVVRSIVIGNGNRDVNQVFVTDPKHEWVLAEEEGGEES